jgi:hypothetical protein
MTRRAKKKKVKPQHEGRHHEIQRLLAEIQAKSDEIQALRATPTPIRPPPGTTTTIPTATTTPTVKDLTDPDIIILPPYATRPIDPLVNLPGVAVSDAPRPPPAPAGSWGAGLGVGPVIFPGYNDPLPSSYPTTSDSDIARIYRYLEGKVDEFKREMIGNLVGVITGRP